MYKGHIVFVSRGNPVWMTLGGFLDQLEKCQRLFFSIDDEGAVEDLVSAMLGVDLRKAKYFRVGKGASKLRGHLVEVIHFFLAERKAFTFIISRNVCNCFDRLWLELNVKNRLIQAIVGFLEHGVNLLTCLQWNEFFDSLNSKDTHIPRDFYRIGRPWGNHFFAWSRVPIADFIRLEGFCLPK